MTPVCRCGHLTTDHNTGWGACLLCACHYFLWEDYTE